jgi:hypothetical protein
MLKGLILSDQVDDIHCVFCLTEDEDITNESEMLRCQCRARSHQALRGRVDGKMKYRFSDVMLCVVSRPMQISTLTAFKFMSSCNRRDIKPKTSSTHQKLLWRFGHKFTIQALNCYGKVPFSQLSGCYWGLKREERVGECG